MQKSTLLLLALLVLSGSIFAACGGSDSVDTEDDSGAVDDAPHSGG